MSFWKYFWRGTEKRSENVSEEATQIDSESLFARSLLFNASSAYNQNQACQLSALYRGIDILSNSIAELPCVVYKKNRKGSKKLVTDHIVYSLLNTKPSKRMNKHNFWKLIVMNMILTGAGYAWIRRDENRVVKELTYIPSNQVSVISNNIFDDVKYLITGIKQYIMPEDMLVFIMIPSDDGVHGISVLQYAKRVLSLGLDELNSASSFFRSGFNKAGILKSDKPLTDSQMQQIQQNWVSTFGTSSGMPSSGVVCLKPGISYESIQASPQDAELLESRKFNISEIARFLGIPLSLMFDNSSTSYSTVEAENLNFLIHSLNPLLDKIETELNTKLWTEAEIMQGYSCKFDSSVLLRCDKKSLAEYYQNMFQMGVLSPNEIRKELDMDAIENGDNHFMQVNISTLDKIAKQPLEDNPTASNQLKGEENTNTEEKEVEDDKD